MRYQELETLGGADYALDPLPEVLIVLRWIPPSHGQPRFYNTPIVSRLYCKCQDHGTLGTLRYAEKSARAYVLLPASR